MLVFHATGNGGQAMESLIAEGLIGLPHDVAQLTHLGTALLRRAEAIAGDSGFARLTVIASVGTREWYAGRGYRLADTYMTRDLTPKD